MTVVLLSADLMGSSRIEGAARLAGVDFQMAGSADAVADCCAKKPVALVIVDLTTAGLDVAELCERLQGRSTNVPAIVAYGPHVHEAVLDAAKEAGCDQVLSRGQFMSHAGDIISHFAAESR